MEDGTFGGRWDGPGGAYRVLYACSQRVGAFLETLAHFRPDPAVARDVLAIESIEGDEDTVAAGGVPAAWCRERLITRGVATDVIGLFVFVGGTATLAHLRPIFAARAHALGLPDLDTGTLRALVPRALTQEISGYLQQQRNPYDDLPFAGIAYLSRHGDDLENWAIFEQGRMRGATPVLSVNRETVDPQDEDFLHALALLGLVLLE